MSTHSECKSDTSLVGEYELIAPVGIAWLRRALPCWLEDADNRLTHGFRASRWGLYEDLQQLDNRIADVDKQIAESVKNSSVAQRLSELRGSWRSVLSGHSTQCVRSLLDDAWSDSDRYR
jgi:hypothetical protein